MGMRAPSGGIETSDAGGDPDVRRIPVRACPILKKVLSSGEKLPWLIATCPCPSHATLTPKLFRLEARMSFSGKVSPPSEETFTQTLVSGRGREYATKTWSLSLVEIATSLGTAPIGACTSTGCGNQVAPKS